MTFFLFFSSLAKLTDPGKSFDILKRVMDSHDEKLFGAIRAILHLQMASTTDYRQAYVR